jgi:hypothetical protein
MTTTRVGAPFQDILSKVKDARVLSETSAGRSVLGTGTTRQLDLNGDGKADAQVTDWKSRTAGNRQWVSFLDAQGRPVDTFVSGGKKGWTMQPGDAPRVWSHTHHEYGSGGQERTIHERANPTTGDLGFRATTVRDGSSVKSTYEVDTDHNGTLETVTR